MDYIQVLAEAILRRYSAFFVPSRECGPVPDGKKNAGPPSAMRNARNSMDSQEQLGEKPTHLILSTGSPVGDITRSDGRFGQKEELHCTLDQHE